MTQNKMPSHFGPKELDMRYPNRIELDTIESGITEAYHTQDETLRGEVFTTLGSAAFMPIEKPAIQTDEPHEHYGFGD